MINGMKAHKANEMAALIPDGATILIGGFMAVGSPQRLIDALVARRARNLTIIANDTAAPGRGIGTLISAGAVVKATVSHIGLNPDTQRKMLSGEIEIERPIRADYALIAAQKADYYGNLEYSLTAQNSNPIMALAGETVIAEPQLIVPVGVIPPDAVKTPGIFVDYLLERAA